MANTRQEHYSSTHPPYPSGQHPFLKVDGKPSLIYPKHGTHAPELDPSNFMLDGRLGAVLRSQGFQRFMFPIIEESDLTGRTTEEIWNWAAGYLGLHRWRHMHAEDLGWFDCILSELDFMVRRNVDGCLRWFLEDAW